MVLFETYSKRRQKRDNKISDIYSYNEIPERVRVQVIHAVKNAVGDFSSTEYHSIEASTESYKAIVEYLRADEGVFFLEGRKFSKSYDGSDWASELFNHFLDVKHQRAIDVIELLCKCIEMHAEMTKDAVQNASLNAERAIEVVNYRLREAAIGYQYVDGEIIRVDSQLLHSDAVVPALEVLRLPGHEGPQSEFLAAYAHYRHGRNAEAINECLKSFESLMKAICDKRGWDRKKAQTASQLIDVCMKNDLFPTYYHAHLIGLKMVLESGIPTPRNKETAHGGGAAPVEVVEDLTSYVIHMTAATLLYLATVEKRLG